MTQHSTSVNVAFPTVANDWKKTDRCQLKGQRGIFEIIFVSDGKFPTVTLAKVNKDCLLAKRRYTGISIKELLCLNEKQPSVDKAGRTAYEAAMELTKSGYVMTDFCRTTSETLAKVIQVTKSGRIHVQELRIIEGLLPRYHGQGKNKVRDIEVDIIDYANLQYKEDAEILTFIPKLFSGEWKFWHKQNKVLRHPKLTKTNLLD